MAIAPSKLGFFVAREGFSWPTRQAAATQDVGTVDEVIVRRLRETGLVRPDATDSEIAKTFQLARNEHMALEYSEFNSPHERVRVFLAPYLTPKGQRWAEPLRSLDLNDDDSEPPAPLPPFRESLDSPDAESGRHAFPWWMFWRR